MGVALDARLHVLLEATRAFAEGAVDAAGLVDVIARRMSDVLADASIVFLAEGERTLVPTCLHIDDEEVREKYRALFAAAPLSLSTSSLNLQVFRDGAPALIPQIDYEAFTNTSAPVYRDFLKDLGVHSLLVVPLRAQGESIGTISLVRFRKGTLAFDETDRDLAQILADHAALALANNRLLHAHRLAESRFSRLSDAGIVGVIVVERDYRVVEINDTLLRMVGYTREEILSGAVPWSSLTPPGYEVVDSMAWEELAASGVAGIREKEYLRKDGTRVPVMLGSAMLDEPGGRVISFVLDLTQRRRAEETIRVEQARFRAVVEKSHDGVMLVSSEGEIELANPGAARIFGAPAKDLVGQPLRCYLREGDRADTDAFHARALPSRTTVHDARCFVRADGSLRWVEAAVTNHLHDPDIGAIVVNLRDVTDRREAESAARDAQGRFRALFESGIAGIIVAESNGRIIEANDAFLEMLGYSRDDLREGKLDWRTLTPPEWNDWSTAVNDELRRSGHAAPREKEYFRKDGTRVPVLVGVAYVDASLAISISIDLTERAKAQEAARAEQERFRALVENTADGITRNDAQGCFAYVSPAAARIFGRDANALLGTCILDVIHPDDREAAVRVMARIRQTPGAVETHTRRIVHPDGSIRWVEITRSNRLEDPSVRGVVCNVRDVTERVVADEALAAGEQQRVHLEAQLRQAQKMEAIGRLAGGIAHDFNNLLSVILSYAEILRDEIEEDGKREDLDEVHRAATRAASLTRQLLLFSRQQLTDPKVVDLRETLANMDKMLRRIIGEDIELITHVADPVGHVFVDPSGVEQVVMNLVVNARDAMPNGGTLTLELADLTLSERTARRLGLSEGDYVVLSVRDDGIGMDRATQARIFEPFYTTKPTGKGTGLGLSTVFGIVTQAHGAVEVDSDLGRGTIFRVYLPRSEGEIVRASAAAPMALRGIETILLVEDEIQVRVVAREILARAGYRVIAATDAIDAIAECEATKERIDLLVTDVVMPRMNGFELATRVLDVRPNTRVLYMSGYTDESIRKDELSRARGPILQKPFTPESLTRKVREALDADD